MNLKNGKLVRSSLLMATASVSLLGARSASAAVTTYFDQATFEGAAAGGGLAQQYVEDFEENTMPFGYSFFFGPLSSGVPNGDFPTGLDAPGLTVDSGSSLIAFKAYADGGYYPWFTSDCVGANGSPDHMTMTFDGGVPAVGFDTIGFNADFGSPKFFDLLDYIIYDTGGGEITSGAFAADGSTFNFFGAISDGALIGSVEVWGTRFGSLDEQEYLDNIQTWGVPSPGALALFGLAGLASRRRRR